jgi:tol-pal system protein YbgF
MKIIVLIMTLLICCGCVTDKDLQSLHLQLANQGARLARENIKLRKQIEALQQKMEEQATTLEKQIVSTSKPVKSRQANLWAEIESLRVQIATLSGQVDAVARNMQRLDKVQTNSTQALAGLSKRVGELERNWQRIRSQLGLETVEIQNSGPADKATISAKGKKGEDVLVPASSAQELYKKALEEFYARKYDLAQSLWDEFVHTFPKNKLVPNAYFWQGECFYQMGDLARAVLAYQEVISKFPRSNKLRPSMLKQGMAFYKLGKKKAGKLVLKDLIKKFPHTVEARRARGFLASAQ